MQTNNTKVPSEKSLLGLQVTWMIAGLVSLVTGFINPYVGWFAAGNLAVLFSGWYVVKEAKSRLHRLLDNQKVFKKMNKQQKAQFLKLDRSEVRNIQAMANMMLPLLTVANGALNVYCYIYYQTQSRVVAPLTFLEGNETMCIVCLVIDLIAAAVFYLALRKEVDTIMKTPEIQIQH